MVTQLLAYVVFYNNKLNSPSLGFVSPILPMTHFASCLALVDGQSWLLVRF